MVRWVSIVMAAAGMAVAIVALTPTFPTPPDLKPERSPSVNPYPRGIAALGVVECSEREASIAPPVSGVVSAVAVKVGDAVRKGDVLLTIDDRQLRAELVRLESAVPVKQAAIDRWSALPRAEDLPPLEALAASAESFLAAAGVELSSAEDDLRRIEEAARERARSERDVTAARFARDQAAARKAEAQAALARARADLAKAQAGGWKPDLVIAQAELEQQKAAVEAQRIELDRLIVRAPRDGVILRRDIEPGEQSRTDPLRPMLVLGDLSVLHVRAQVDEEDIALVRTGARALGRTRGAVVDDIPLTIVRIEPYARGKSQLTGANSERVDTRVVEVLLRVDPASKRTLYPGQALDVYIEGPGAK